VIAPQGWIVIIHKPCWHFGPFGRYAVKLKRIDIYPPHWVPKSFGLRRWVIEKSRQHELAHAWGIKGCKRPWCLMFEASAWRRQWKEPWWEKLAGFFQACNRFGFCREHEKYLERSGAL